MAAQGVSVEGMKAVTTAVNLTCAQTELGLQSASPMDASRSVPTGSAVPTVAVDHTGRFFYGERSHGVTVVFATGRAEMMALG